MPSVSRISSKRQVVIPNEICKTLGAKTGDFVEFFERQGEVIVKLKKLVDADLSTWNKPSQGLPPAPSREERNRLLDALQGNAEDDSGDIPLDKIKAARVSSTKIVEFD